MDNIQEQDVTEMKLKYMGKGSSYASFAGRENSTDVQYRNFDASSNPNREQVSDTVLKKKKQGLEPPIFSTNQFQGHAQDQMRQDSRRSAASSVQQMHRYQTSRDCLPGAQGTSGSFRNQAETPSLHDAGGQSNRIPLPLASNQSQKSLQQF